MIVNIKIRCVNFVLMVLILMQTHKNKLNGEMMEKEIKTNFREVGSKSNPSYVIPVDKGLIKEEKINVKKLITVRIKQ